MRLKNCMMAGISMAFIGILCVGCGPKGQNNNPQASSGVKSNTVESREQLVVNGVVVYENNTIVPDSLKCTVMYFDFATNKDITIPIKNGTFLLTNLVDEKYKLEAVSGVGGLRGSCIFTIRNGHLVGSKSTDDFVRVILGKEKVEEAPVPPGFFEGDIIPAKGIIRDN
ncbi:hypothetical protein LLG96_13935 [bacterium]|nr:hypothetical protein [bacterium]